MEVDVAIAVSVKHVLHEGGDVVLRSVDFVLEQVVLEVLVRDVAVAIDIEGPEDFESFWLPACEGDVLNFLEETAEPAGLSLVLDRLALLVLQVLIDETWRRICPGFC